MKLYERLMVITIIGIVLLFIKFHLVKDNDVVLTELQPSVPIGLLVDTPGCVLPKFEVVSSEVQHLFKSTTGKYDCGGVPQFIQSVHSKLIINKDILRKYYELDYAKCRYWIVNRQKKNLYLPDDSFFLSEPAGQSYFDSEINPEADVLYVKCYDYYQDLFYKNYHSVIVPKKKTNKPPTSEKLNILVFGIDSVSKLNFLRHFPKTYDLLKKLNAYEFHGYNKVEDSTLVNMMPFLTGKYLNYFENKTELRLFDKIEFMWNQFSKLGYKTLYAEDFAEIGMFNYQKKGFINPPTDHYYRPYAVSVDHSFIKRRSKDYCIDDRIEAAFMIDWVKQFTEVYQNDSFYGFMWSSIISHDKLNMVGYMDDESHNLIELLNKTNVLNNTLLIFLSDHGIRYGEILETYVGRFEQRLPFLFLLFPKWFRDKHSAWHEKLTVNQHRLITPFDLYEMQKDLLKLAGGTTISNSMHESTGISLFKEISKTRTCNEATISPHYCACDKYEKIDKSSPKIAAASLLVISYINNRTASERHHCCEVFFQKLIEASKMAHSSFKEHFRLVLSVTPGNGIFESTVSHNSKAGTYHIESSVIRINKYGGQSHCTKRFTLKPYCVCK